jgi:hypothetical protein
MCSEMAASGQSADILVPDQGPSSRTRSLHNASTKPATPGLGPQAALRTVLVLKPEPPQHLLHTPNRHLDPVRLGDVVAYQLRRVASDGAPLIAAAAVRALGPTALRQPADFILLRGRQ